MPTPIPSERLPGLKAALDQFGEGETASQQQLAEIYGVTNARMSTLIKERFVGFPPVAERREDKTNHFPARAAIAVMIRYIEDAKRGKKARKARQGAVMQEVATAKEAAADQPEPLTAAELDRLASAQTKLFRLAREKGMYTPTADVTRMVRDTNALFTRELMNLANEIDPNGELPAAQRKRLVDKSRQIIAKMHDAVAAYLKGDDDAEYASPARPGAGDERAPRRRRPGASRGPVGAAA